MLIEGASSLFWTRGNLFWVNCCFSVSHKNHCLRRVAKIVEWNEGVLRLRSGHVLQGVPHDKLLGALCV